MAENPTLAEKLLSVQAELKAPKSQYNNFGKYAYRNAEDIVEAVKPLAKKHGVLLTLSDEVVIIGERTYIKATARVTDINDNEKTIESTAYAREPENKKGMDESQITGAASSYARKYALNGLFAIDDTKDADNDTPAKPKKNEELEKIKDKIIKICIAAGGKENEELMAILEKYVSNRNPKSLKDIDKAKECLAAVKKVNPKETEEEDTDE